MPDGIVISFDSNVAYLDAEAVGREIHDLVDASARDAHRMLVEQEPHGHTGELRRHTEREPTLVDGLDFEAAVGVTPIENAAAGGIVGAGRPGPLGGTKFYPLFVARGTGLFEESETGLIGPIIPKVRERMVFREDGRTIFATHTIGQRPNPYPRRAFVELVAAMPEHIEAFGRKLQLEAAEGRLTKQ